MTESKARSGRTTRMMQKAVKFAEAGRRTYVCFSSQAECHSWEQWRSEHAPRATNISFDTLNHFDVNWQRMELRGAHPNCRLLVDHYVIATFMSQFSKALEMMEEFDDPEGSEGGSPAVLHQHAGLETRMG